MKRLTVRLDNSVANALEKYKTIFNIYHEKISLNQIINILIIAKLPPIKIKQKYINYFLKFKHKADNLHSKKFYQNYTNKLAQLTNSINVITRQIKGIATNINQLTHETHLDGNAINSQQLKSYQRNMSTLNRYCILLSERLVILWQM